MPTDRIRTIWPILTLAVLLLLSCATTGPGGRKSLILISDKQEVSIG